MNAPIVDKALLTLMIVINAVLLFVLVVRFQTTPDDVLRAHKVATLELRAEMSEALAVAKYNKATMESRIPWMIAVTENICRAGDDRWRGQDEKKTWKQRFEMTGEQAPPGFLPFREREDTPRISLPEPPEDVQEKIIQ